MSKEIILILILVLAILLFVLEMLTEGADAIKYFFYKGIASGKIVNMEKFSVSRSRRLVEKDSGQGYEPVRTTQDKSLNYFYFASPTYWAHKKKKDFPVIEWKTPGEKWKGHYPYAGNREIGAEVSIHYNINQPWKYAIKDKSLYRSIFFKCFIYIIFFAAALALLLQRIS